MKSSITCGCLGLAFDKSTPCLEDERKRRCIDVPMNECRMKPIDSRTGRKLRRKFTVKKEGVEAEWWKK